MKILAIDDQPLILLAIREVFMHEDFDLVTYEDPIQAMQAFDTINPDLVILDLRMPNMDGFEVLRKIRNDFQKDIPVIVMSGMSNEDLIIKSFQMGASDFIQKPVGVKELDVRVRRLLKMPLGASDSKVKTDAKASERKTIQHSLVGVVVPCYNESKRIDKAAFQNFVDNNLGFHICFVNDGSKDNTLEVLEELVAFDPKRLSVLDLPKNGGKAEAVRQGILHLVKDSQLDYFGYLDADLSTDFEDYKDLVQALSNSSYEIVAGSRIARVGANIKKASSRAVISTVVNQLIQSILNMPFQDTQCGAKVMTRKVAEHQFNEPFVTSWLFDVELFLRIKEHFPNIPANDLICELPLKRWVHEEGSNLSMKDSFKILGQLAKLKLVNFTK